MKKILLFSLFSLLFLLSACGEKEDTDSKRVITANVSSEGGKQLINMMAKGGFEPNETVAKSGVDSIIRVETRGTFDCSSSLVIPFLDYKTNLPPTGVTDIDLPSQEKGSTLFGSCSMGMYNFEIKFI